MSDPGKMLSLLAGMGLPGAVLGMLGEMGNAWTLDQRRFVAGPIIVHQSPWMADIPPWMFPQARAERVDIVTGLMSGHIIGPTEIAAVMMPRTMEAPMSREMTELYLWAAARAASKHRKITLAEFHKAIGEDRPITDGDVIARGGRLFEDYRQLASDILRKVIAHQTQRERAEKREARETGSPIKTPARPRKPAPEIIQQSLF